MPFELSYKFITYLPNFTILHDCLQLAHCLPNKITHLCSSDNKWVCFSFSNSNRLAGPSHGRCLVHFLNYIPLICWPLQSSTTAHNNCGCILKIAALCLEQRRIQRGQNPNRLGETNSLDLERCWVQLERVRHAID